MDPTKGTPVWYQGREYKFLQRSKVDESICYLSDPSAGVVVNAMIKDISTIKPEGIYERLE